MYMENSSKQPCSQMCFSGYSGLQISNRKHQPSKNIQDRPRGSVRNEGTPGSWRHGGRLRGQRTKNLCMLVHIYNHICRYKMSQASIYIFTFLHLKIFFFISSVPVILNPLKSQRRLWKSTDQLQQQISCTGWKWWRLPHLASRSSETAQGPWCKYIITGESAGSAVGISDS